MMSHQKLTNRNRISNYPIRRLEKKLNFIMQKNLINYYLQNYSISIWKKKTMTLKMIHRQAATTPWRVRPEAWPEVRLLRWNHPNQSASTNQKVRIDHHSHRIAQLKQSKLFKASKKNLYHKLFNKCYSLFRNIYKRSPDVTDHYKVLLRIHKTVYSLMWCAL